MKPLILICALLGVLSAQDAQRGGSLDQRLLNRLRDPKWGAALDRLEANAKKAEALALKLQILAAKARAKRDKLLMASGADPAARAKAEAATAEAAAAEVRAHEAEDDANEKRGLAGEARKQLAAARKAGALVQTTQRDLDGAKAQGDTVKVESLTTDLKARQGAAAVADAQANRVFTEENGALPAKHLIPGLESAGVSIHTYFGTRWSNLYRDPQATDTYFRPKGFFALEHEQYFWLTAYPQLLSKWGGGAMIQGSKESDFQGAATASGFRKAVTATDTASAHAYFWLGGFITDTTTLGLFLQHQFSNYSLQPSDDPNAPKTFGFTDVIKSQRRLGFLLQQHDAVWRGSLLEYSNCSDPLFTDSRNRQFLRGRAMYNFDAIQSLGFYLEGSINRGRRSDRDRDDATITLGFRVDLRVWSSPD